MTFKIVGTGMGPLVLSPKDRKIGVPDLEVLFNSDLYSDHSEMEAIMEDILDTLLDKEKMMPHLKKCAEEKKKKTPICFDIQSITANHKKNAFTVVWGDGSHTIIHLQPGDVWDDEKALAMCFVKHLMGDKGSFNDIFTEDMPKKIKRIGNVEPVEEKHESAGVKKLREVCATVGIDTVPSTAEKAAGASVSAALNEMKAAAEKTNISMKKMIDELTGEPVKVQRYDLFLMDPCGDKIEIYHQGTDEEIHKAMRAYRMKHYPILEANRTPYRVWMIKGNLMVDFGAGSYFMVPGMDHDTFVKK
jgi:hypothetical protein